MRHLGDRAGEAPPQDQERHEHDQKRLREGSEEELAPSRPEPRPRRGRIVNESRRPGRLAAFPNDPGPMLDVLIPCTGLLANLQIRGQEGHRGDDDHQRDDELASDPHG